MRVNRGKANRGFAGGPLGRWCAVLLPLLCSACLSQRAAYHVPPIELPASYAQAPGAADPRSAVLQVAGLAPELDEWWKQLGSAELERLVAQALQHNPDLKIANLRMEQAQLRVNQAAGARWPELNLPLQAKSEAPEDGLGSLRPGQPSKTQHTYQLGLRLDWQPDIWGEKQAGLDATRMQWYRALFQRDDTRRQLLASLANAYIEYLSLNDRLRVAREIGQLLEGMLLAVQARYDRQDATITELEQQRAAVYAVRATMPALELQRAESLHALQFLSGTAQPLQLSDAGLDSLRAPQVAPGLPALLLLRRPDIRVLEARLLGADADIDVARARILPSFDLSMQYGMGSHVLSELFSPQARLWNVVTNLSANIFDGGKRRAEVDYARSVHREMVESYMRVIYLAMREVNSALTSVDTAKQRAGLQQVAVDASLRAWQHSRRAWDAGALDTASLLEAERSYQRNLDESLRIRQEHLRGLVNLFAALGGGVTPQAALPGQGSRPQQHYLQASVLLAPASHAAKAHSARLDGQSAAPSAPETQASTPPEQEPARLSAPGLALRQAGEAVWIAELGALGQRADAAQLWRQLRQRFPQEMQERQLLMRKVGGRLLAYAGNFSSIEEGEQWCETLREILPACQILPAQAIGGQSAPLKMSTVLGASEAQSQDMPRMPDLMGSMAQEAADGARQ
ncbi:efflux transporter outer membrane subunit [Massilia sp. W12]|uniref:efflux transporter outer membrane subunit n=1 Tax=Massilia sp. W12 TaxID=3126507 RepID=UPI0030D389EA